MVQTKPTSKSVTDPVTNHTPRRPDWVPNTDVFIAPSGVLTVCLELSGMQAGDIEIIADGNRLRITGERPNSGVATAKTVLVHEINDGRFNCVLDIPPSFDVPRASSAYLSGTLRITVPPVSNPQNPTQPGL